MIKITKNDKLLNTMIRVKTMIIANATIEIYKLYETFLDITHKIAKKLVLIKR